MHFSAWTKVWMLVPAFVGSMLLGQRARAEEPKEDSSKLTLKRIFQSHDLEGKRFSGRWLKEEPGYTTLEKSAETPGGKDIVRHDPDTDAREVLVPASLLIPSGASAPLPVEDYAWSKKMAKVLIFTHSKRVWRTHSRGDYWVLDRTSRELSQLGGDAPASTLMFAKFSPDGERVAYVRDRDLYAEDLDVHHVIRLTTAGTKDLINGTFDWVYEEEFFLRDGFRWSPDGQSLVYWQIDTRGVRAYPLVNRTDSLYPKVTWIKYPKAGERNSAARIGVVGRHGGTTRWLEVPGDPRNHYLHYLDWPKGLDGVVLQQLNRLQNTNRVLLASPGTGRVRELWTDRDDAWVEFENDFRWLPQTKEFVFLSERDGWQHLYRASPGAAKPKRITDGDYDVVDLLEVNEKSGWVSFIASPDDPAGRYLYRVRLSGRHLERLTPAGLNGTHSYQISPDGKWAFHTFSSFDEPPRTDLISLPDHRRVRVLEDNKALREKVKKLDRANGEFFRVEIEKGVALDAWCLRPPTLDPGKKYPLLVYVYGEPAGQTVLNRWGGNTYLWHLLLAQEGYVVITFDNRGTPAPRGRAWRKSIYRQVGILAVEDQARALKKVLADRSYLDPDRVGVWGWSGGGSMTLDMLFKHPDLYRTGVAVAPVPNQRLYDSIYQERYMGLPRDNVKGYRDGSAITFAGQLKGHLLLIHGTGDDNVHYQGSEDLINELIRLNKPFTMMAYPNRTHAINEGANTTLHLHELMADYWQDHLPAGPKQP
jgi:dipeptidyl-peptidase 4